MEKIQEERENEERRKRGEPVRKKLKTRADSEKEKAFKAKDAARKRLERAKLTDQQKKEINRKRREKNKAERERVADILRQQKELEQQRMAQKEQLEAETKRLMEEWAKLEQAKKTNNPSPAKRKRLSRARASISNDPVQYAQTVNDLVNKASPRKKKLLERSTGNRNWKSLVTDELANKFKELRKSRKKKDLELKRAVGSTLKIGKKYKMQKKICKELKISSKILHTKKTTVHKRKVTEEVKEAVHASYEKLSITLPDKRFVSKKTGKPAGFLTVPISTVYTDFRSSNPNVKMGLSKFAAMRPQHIKLRSQVKYRGCLCEYCANMEHKITAINRVAHRHNLKSPLTTVKSLSKITLCDKGDSQFHKIECIERRCSQCGVNKITERLQNLLDAEHGDDLPWKKWERDPDSKKMILKAKNTNLVTIIEDLEKDAEPYAQHLFSASWQASQYAAISKQVPEGCIVMVYDFAENYACRYQDEIQSVHWGHEAATLHPIVSNYQCPRCKEVMTHSLVMVTDDNSHDFHAVNQFTVIALEHLKKEVSFDKVIRFSDGAPNQYKSKGPFLDVSHAKSDYNVEFQHEFFGSRHGKGPSDGESGVIKRMATDAVIGGTAIIRNAKEMFEFIRSKATRPVEEDPNNCSHFKRTAFWVEGSSIARNRRQAKRTVEGTRLIHSVVSVQPGVIKTRNLSCFCPGCLQGEDESCERTSHVKPYQQR